MVKIPDIKPGDLVKVYSKIIEGDKERVTPFQGVVIQIKGRDIHRTFTVRKISAGVGIERIFPLHSPMITKIEIKKKGKVRRAKLTYLRQRHGKRMKIKESAAGPVTTVTEKTPVDTPPETRPEPKPDEKKDTPGPSKEENKKGSKDTSSEDTAGPEPVEKT